MENILHIPEAAHRRRIRMGLLLVYCEATDDSISSIGQSGNAVGCGAGGTRT